MRIASGCEPRSDLRDLSYGHGRVGRHGRHGEEREGIWAAQKVAFPGFADYERKTGREIPVVVLEPAP
ncbi:nitroreductase/quinone reductase family protein [Micromonospora wenchangensis]|uniref:nitroreductase/quinone reductase family protein n=1 Tax=Micromonospora wenchangensis TaxID=1185415 RepID=UPI0038136AA7